MDHEEIKNLCDRFGIQGEYKYYELITNGHINKTYVVYFFRDGELKDYILQRINTYVFKNPIDVMNNISSVTQYLRLKIKERQDTAKRNVLHYQKSIDGLYYYIDDKGGFWRCCRYIDDSVTFNMTEDLKVIEECGAGFGDFQNYLAEYPADELAIVIPHFHNTVMRYATFKKSVEDNLSGRKANVENEIKEYLELEDIATKMYKMSKTGELPLKVTHNDTKCNNVLFDKNTHEHLAVIDLDTVMPGLVGFDFGDAIRFIGNSAEEDEKDLSKVYLDMKKFEAFTKGFVGVVKDSLTEKEKETLPLGAISMTLECGIRFLGDYIDGDKYFNVDYPEQNAVRAKCQLALAKDMIKKYDEMADVVKKYL
ncbi:MAG: phosphotransferase [Clostridia bacterium]|nr:phosphotransferase [Clostridia bacterium]